MFDKKIVCFLVVSLTVGCASLPELTREQKLVEQQLSVEDMLQENIKDFQIYSDSNIDPKNAIVIGSAFVTEKSYNTINYIPVGTSEHFRPSGMMFTDMETHAINFAISGPDWHVYEVPAGSYYLSRVVAKREAIHGVGGMFYKPHNYISGRALDEDNKPQYGSIHLKPGEVVYLGDLNTYSAQNAIVSYKNFIANDRGGELKKYLSAYYPSIADKVDTRIFKIQSPEDVVRVKLNSLTPERHKEKRKEELLVLSDSVDLGSRLTTPSNLTSEYIQRLNSDENRVKLYKEIYLNWLNDPVLFNEIAWQVQGYVDNTVEHDERSFRREMFWAMKALASSGLPEYIKVFENIYQRTDDADMKKRSMAYLKELKDRAIQSKVIHSDRFAQHKWEWDLNRAVNKANSSNDKIKIQGVSEVLKYRGKKDKALYEVIKNVLMESVQSDKFDRYERKFQLLAAKVLARSRHREYIEVLKQIEVLGKDEKVREYAGEYAEYLERSLG